MPGERQRDRQTAAAGSQLQDRAPGPFRQGEVQVQVARILRQVQVVQPGESRGRGRIDGVSPPSARDRRPRA